MTCRMSVCDFFHFIFFNFYFFCKKKTTCQFTSVTCGIVSDTLHCQWHMALSVPRVSITIKCHRVDFNSVALYVFFIQFIPYLCVSDSKFKILKKSLAMLLVSSTLWQDIKCVILLKRSTTTKIESKPPYVLGSPKTKSMLISS